MGAVLRATGIATMLVVVYYTLPFDGRLDGPGLLLLPIGLCGLCVLTWYAVASIIRSPTPRARAIEVLATVVPLFVILFASTYYVMTKHNTASFSTISDRTDSLYFTVTVFSTVGFGDIVPISQPARILVTIQMVGDLVLIGAGVRILSGAVRLGMGRRSRDADRPAEPWELSGEDGGRDVTPHG
jgi:hypothetical protein